MRAVPARESEVETTGGENLSVDSVELPLKYMPSNGGTVVCREVGGMLSRVRSAKGRHGLTVMRCDRRGKRTYANF